MKEQLHDNLRKLALAYETGWEYRKGTEEPGSVIAGICLDMLEENLERFDRIWDKHACEFLQSVPIQKKECLPLKGSIVIDARELEKEELLPAGTALSTVTEEGRVLAFRTGEEVWLTPAFLQAVFYTDGSRTWQVYKQNSMGRMEFAPCTPFGEPLEEPRLIWCYRDLLNCIGNSRIRVSFRESGEEEAFRRLCLEEKSRITVSDGSGTYELCPGMEADMLYLKGDTEGFAHNREETIYRICVDIPDTVAGSEAAQVMKNGPSLLAVCGRNIPQIIITEEETAGETPVLPFGRGLDESSCCYLACDEILAGEGKEIRLSLEEEYLLEERLPEPKTEEYKKKMKKYAWMLEEPKVWDWRVTDTAWEYFDGNTWHILPESTDWQICRTGKAAAWKFVMHRPADMQPCVVEGMEHFYIRVRIRHTQNAYTEYYRKYIPVWKSITLEKEEVWRKPEPGENGKGPDIDSGRSGEGLYLFFDRELPTGYRLYTELLNRETGGAERTILHAEDVSGYGAAFRLGAERHTLYFNGDKIPFAWRQGIVREMSACYTKIVQFVPPEADDGRNGEQEETQVPFVEAGSIFTLETISGRQLTARAAESTVKTFAAEIGTESRQEAQGYYSHFGRIVTAGDIAVLCRQKFPFLKDVICKAERKQKGKKGILNVTFLLEKEDFIAPDHAAAGAEAVKWLEGLFAGSGILWLAEYSVKVTMTVM